MSVVFDPTVCELGEGPLWHPTRGQLFWFDILGRKLLTRHDGATRTWAFDRIVSAAGWVDETRLLIATETGLILFDLESGASEDVVPLENDNPGTRSNDGRADPWGGFWIGTMGKDAAEHAGAIYRYYKGEMRTLFPGIKIPNAICFATDGGCAYYTDTPTGIVMRQALSTDHGWPKGDPEPWLDLRSDGLNPDGAVVDSQGNFWNAQWGARRVACYDPAGHFQHAVEFDADHTSCPAFGGPDLSALFCTTALEHLADAQKAGNPHQGMTFVSEDAGTGQAEHRIIL
jgi:sugar lactone lactonase YvrE